jgi:outer membrane biosynthesis protein TonB
MAKKDIKGMLGNKSPSALRHAVQQVDILKEAAAALDPTEKENDTPDEQIQSVKEPALSDEKEVDKESFSSVEARKRTSQQRQETDHKNRSTPRRKPKVFSSKDVQAVLESDKRQTERYSFEIYSDQKQDIQQVCDFYEHATGKKLSASRLIREVLDTFLPDALKTFESSMKESDEK